MLQRDFRSLWLLAVLGLVAASGCGTHVGAQASASALRPSASASANVAISTPTPSPLPSTPQQLSAAPVLSAPARPINAAPMPMQFPLVAVTGAVRGQVTVTTLPGSYRLQVRASGLPPGSAHSVHLHFGSCPSAGVHLAVLGTLVADGTGSGSLTVTVGRPFAGNGRYVIVYTRPIPGPLAACAQLAG